MNRLIVRTSGQATSARMFDALNSGARLGVMRRLNAAA